MKRVKVIGEKLLIGWNEWCHLPELSLPYIKCKVDTGAKTSAIHAFDIEPYHMRGVKHVRFKINPIQGDDHTVVQCYAQVVDERNIMSSNGHNEHRYVISTKLCLGAFTWWIQATLSNRDPLKFRMLLGREALEGRVYINPGITCNQGTLTKSLVYKGYAFARARSRS